MGRGWKRLEVHARTSPLAMNGPLKVICVRDQKRTVEKISTFLKYLSACEQKVGRNTDGKGYSDEVSDGNEEVSLETGMAIFVTQQQRAWLSCVHLPVFCGRQNL